MSFILDALRKSETERQRQSGPALADAGFRPPARRRGVWLPLLIVALVANLVVMATLWLRREPGATPTAPVAAAPPAAPAPPVSNPVKVPAAGSTAADAEFAAMAEVPAEEPAPAAELADTAQEPELATGVPAAPDAGPRPQVIRDELPTAQQLAAEGSLSVPDMHLDIHVFSTTPKERFVMINMRRYTEGTQLSEGPRVEEITPDGVVLSHGGQRFLLARD
jgi:general secretion pathway protein B